MNKTLHHKFLFREVTLCYNKDKVLICYILNILTPNFKRVLSSKQTTDRVTAKKFLNLID